MSEERFLSSLNDARIEKIKKDSNELRDGFFKSKIKEIRKDVYRIQKKKSFHTKNKRDWKNLLKLEKGSF